MQKKFEWFIDKNNKEHSSRKLMIKTLNKQFGLYCIITLRYNQELQKLKDNDKFIKLTNYLKSAFYNELSKVTNKQIDFFGFQSLSTDDLVLIILGDNIKNFFKILNLIKSTKYSCKERDKKHLFEFVSVFTGFNDNQFSDNPKMDLRIKLLLKPSVRFDEFLLELKNKEPDIFNNDCITKVFSGNSHLELVIPSQNNILSLFHNDQIFNGSSEFYRNFIKDSQTFWIELYKEDVDLKDKDKIIIKITDQSLREFINNKYERSEYKIDLKVEIRNPVAQFIVNEYERLIDTPRYSNWKHILEDQLYIVKTFINDYENDNKEKSLHELLNYIQISLTYINQACSPLHEVPNHNYFYSGSYNDLLKMYYGIISNILQLGYGFHHDKENLQHKIFFAVNFETTTKVHSKMFTSHGSEEKRLVVFHIPYDDFYNYPKTIPVLIHEIFHYIAPYSRKSRIINLWDILLNFILIKILNNYFPKRESLTENDQYRIFKFYVDNMTGIKDEFMQCLLNNNISLYDETLPELLNRYFETYEVFQPIYELILTDIVIYIYDTFAIIKEVGIKEYFSKYEIELECDLDKDDFDIIKNLQSVIKELNKDTDVFDFASNIISASKEAFCDAFIVEILNLDIKQYLRLFINNLKDIDDASMLSLYLRDPTRATNKSNLDSMEIRLYLVIQYIYYRNKEKLLENDFTNWVFSNFKNEFLNTIETDNFVKVFKQYILDSFSKFSKYYSFCFGKLFEMTFSRIEEWFNLLNEDSKNIVEKLRLAYNENPDQSIVLESVQNFSYSYLDSFNIKTIDTKVIPKDYNLNQMSYVTSIQEYIERIFFILDYSDSKDQIWYRGVCSSKYLLTPSLFRSMDHSLSLYTNQANILKKAYEKTLSYDDLWSESTNIVKRMGILQHYGMSTNLLDFSLDMLVALYFALNPENSKDKKQLNEGKICPVVYVFNPVKYNKAISFLLNGQDINNYDLNISPIIYDINNEDVLSKYFVKNMSFDYLKMHTEKHNKEYVPSPRKDDYPIPIIVQQNNNRIQAQNGAFLAYSLYSQPNKNVNDKRQKYDYLSLQNIQRNYENALKRAKLPNEKFLYKIQIAPDSVMLIRESLEKMNVTEGKVYPELNTLFKKGMEEYRESFSNSINQK